VLKSVISVSFLKASVRPQLLFISKPGLFGIVACCSATPSIYGAGIGLSRWGKFFLNFCVFLDDNFVLEAAVCWGAGSLHHLTLHQLSPTASSPRRDWIEQKR